MAVAISYWPGRWARTTIVAALALEPMVTAMAAQQWTELLDQLEATVGDLEADSPRFL